VLIINVGLMTFCAHDAMLLSLCVQDTAQARGIHGLWHQMPNLAGS
jgi:hypothetical protein